MPIFEFKDDDSKKKFQALIDQLTILLNVLPDDIKDKIEIRYEKLVNKRIAIEESKKWRPRIYDANDMKLNEEVDS